MRTVPLMAQWVFWWCCHLTIILIPPNAITALESFGQDYNSKDKLQHARTLDTYNRNNNKELVFNGITQDAIALPFVHTGSTLQLRHKKDGDTRKSELILDSRGISPFHSKGRRRPSSRKRKRRPSFQNISLGKHPTSDGSSVSSSSQRDGKNDDRNGSLLSSSSSSSSSTSAFTDDNASVVKDAPSTDKSGRQTSKPQTSKQQTSNQQTSNLTNTFSSKSSPLWNDENNVSDSSRIGHDFIYKLHQFDAEEEHINLPKSEDNDEKLSQSDDLPRSDDHYSNNHQKILPVLLNVAAPNFFQDDLTLVLEPVSEFLSPGFVIQRVQGNSSWLEEFHDAHLDCYYSGFVFGHRKSSNVAISLCDGARGIIQLEGEKYAIEPVREPSSSSSTSSSPNSDSTTSSSSSASSSTSSPSETSSSSSSSSSASTSKPSSPSSSESSESSSSSSSSESSKSSKSSSSPPLFLFSHRSYTISKLPTKNVSTTSNCSITENFKHHRLKSSLEGDATPNDYNVNNNKYNMYKQGGRKESATGGSRGKEDRTGTGRTRRQKRSVGVSRKHTVETLVVADAKMYQYHGRDTQQYVLTLMSIVRSIYRHPSIGNYINVVVVKLVIFETEWEMPFKVHSNAVPSLKEFCSWQESANDFTPNSPKHHDTAILITRQDICRAEGKCDTLGLAEIGTICDPLRTCSIIEDNGISAAFTIAHELGHVFNLPHDDEKGCAKYQPRNGKSMFHVMAPTLDYNASPWDWSNCSAQIMTEFLESGRAKCLYDGVRVKKWNNLVKDTDKAGWTYSINRQCELIFGKGYVVCPFSVGKSNSLCRRLWCTNDAQGNTGTGCRTKHMPWADGTPCSSNKICQEGKCIPIPNSKPNPINGGWGPWQVYGPCSRTCGGGVKKKIRECNSPMPKHQGNYCLGTRVRYKSCNVKPCPIDSRDFRMVQCDSDEMKSKFQFKGLPQNTTWVPKYNGVHMKDACKLYCSAANSSSYFQFASKVIDGTKCGPFTDDVCVNGQCWKVGCDNRLGSTLKRDRCGVCGGDNYTCRTVTGYFNNAVYGYNLVGSVPSGATDVDIRQYGQDRHYVDDENYLALKNSENAYILNGDSLVRTQPWKVKVKGALISYTGSHVMMERINSSMMIEEKLQIYVLAVGKLNPPNITYSYMVSVTKNVVWKNQGWSKCNAICNGERKSRIVCTRDDDNLIVSKRRCKGRKKPSRITERCNADCKVSWRVFNEEECPIRCGSAMKRQLVHCIKQTGYKNAEIINDKHCKHVFGTKPDEIAECTGKCLDSYWSYTDWSTCSRTCGEGMQERQAKCVDESGKELPNKECNKKDMNISRKCNNGECAEWTTGNWLGCSATCGSGYKLRKVWCYLGGKKMDDSACSKKKPLAKKACHLKTCPEWYPGGWGPCSASCGKGINMRAVKCQQNNRFTDDSVCDLTMRPTDKRACFMGGCPTPKPVTTTTLKTIAKAAYWRYGSWTECSASCGAGTKHRYVSCMDYDSKYVKDSECDHLAQPPKVESCMLKPCGNWRQGDWSDCTVTCGEGIQTRFVACLFNEQRQDDAFCDVTIKPETEILCNRGTCITPDDFSVAVITSNSVVGTSHWKVGHWSACSSTCGSGWERRHVMCRDERGASSECDKNEKPDDFRFCSSGHCPSWSIENWSECSAKKCGDNGYETRLVVCRLPNGDILANSNCDSQNKAIESRPCKGLCTGGIIPSSTSSFLNGKNKTSSGRVLPTRWKEGPWSVCSVTCGQGIKSRSVICTDRAGHKLSPFRCRRRKPRNTKRCHRGQCPKWVTGKWTKCSVTCGKGLRKRAVRCKNKRQKYVEDVYCDHSDRPKTITHCSRRQCVHYMWHTGPWSECTRSCGFGRKHRSVTCVDRSGTAVTPHICDQDKKPKVKRRCSEFPCPYIWNSGPWSECSATCGEGKQTRHVMCQAVTKEGWILPEEVHYGCRPEKKQSTARYCNYGDCASLHHWKVGPWGQCTVPCGFGRQRRSVICVNKAGEQVKRRHCLPLYRPVTTRPCYNGRCYASSCKEFKKYTTIRRDGDYRLKVGNQLIKIYCKNMRKEPEEYISLHQGPQENFSENFDKRLRRPNTCPFNGTRPADKCLECRRKTHDQAGNTTFSKVRIDIRTLKIITSDTSFSNTATGKMVPFGNAGDCYSSNNCPQGRFSINLVNTGFAVSPNTTWVLHGNRAYQRIWRLRQGQIIRGVCGGNCGVCTPEAVQGIQLELFR